MAELCVAFEATMTTCSCISATGLPAAVSEAASPFLCLETNWSYLKKAIEDLKAIEARVKDKVAVETIQLNSCDPQVELWQTRVADLIDEEETIEKEYNKLYRFPCLCSCTPNLRRRHRLGKRIACTAKAVNKLIEEEKQFQEYGQRRPPDIVEERPKTRTFVLEPVLKRLVEYFDDEERSIIGIWGQGGIGKTTLLNELNNELENRRGEFNVVIAIDVLNSEKLNVADIQRTITERLGLPWNEEEREETRASFLLKVLKRKKFVILLDQVWEGFRLEEVGIPAPDEKNKCKLILASRFQKVCTDMGARSLIEVALLDEKAAWNLFRSNLTSEAAAAIDDSPEDAISGYATAIAKNCGGLPLALNVIGSAVAGLKNRMEWSYAVKATKDGLVKFVGDDKMFGGLAYSYERLDPKLQQCFLYCTLFPADGWIKKDQLVEYWMAEGLIDDANEGYFNMRRLVSASLLQSNYSDSKVKMHQIIREFGLPLARKQANYFVMAGMGLEKAPLDSWKEATRISLMSNNIKDISISTKCKNLLTLLVQNNPKLARLSPQFFVSMPSLRVLDLSYTAITELPVCNALIKLRLLNLRHTLIAKLPENFSILKQLRHLDLSITSALENTSDNCSKLLKLRVLNLFRSKYGIRDVNDLNIDTLKKLDFLGITIHAQDVLSKLNKKHPLARSTHRLSLKYCNGMEKIQISELKEMVHLEELYIESCGDLKELTADADERRASCLQVLTLAVLSNLHTVSVGKVPHYFRKVTNLTIYTCHKLDNLTWVLQLESLEKLVVSHCDGMTRIVEETQNEKSRLESKGLKHEEEIEEEVEQGTNRVMRCTGFRGLRSIILNDLKLLESICGARELSCLENIRVEACPKLKRLPVIGNNKMLKLKRICGSNEWWEQLIWEDEGMKVNLNESFIAI
ncbi:disease resistance protein RPS2-like [Typha angustifolia]|uniref:disease resistance protein RPS2-like n=1 Tax=Typha angustifolia TaxID=59011 RepID=UPI003C2C18D5